MPTTNSTAARARSEKIAALHAELDSLPEDREAVRGDIEEQLDELNVASARSMGLLVGNGICRCGLVCAGIDCPLGLLVG